MNNSCFIKRIFDDFPIYYYELYNSTYKINMRCVCVCGLRRHFKFSSRIFTSHFLKFDCFSCQIFAVKMNNNCCNESYLPHEYGENRSFSVEQNFWRVWQNLFGRFNIKNFDSLSLSCSLAFSLKLNLLTYIWEPSKSV